MAEKNLLGRPLNETPEERAEREQQSQQATEAAITEIVKLQEIEARKLWLQSQQQKRKQPAKPAKGRKPAAVRSLRSYFAGDEAYKIGLNLLTQNRTPAGAASVFLFLQEKHPELLSGGRAYLKGNEPSALFKAIERELGAGGNLGRASGFRRKLNEGLTDNSRTTIATLQDLLDTLQQ